jgi:hypothetical protein
MRDLMKADPNPEAQLYLLPVERQWFASFGFLMRLPNGSTVTTRECGAAGVCPAGVRVLPRKRVWTYRS